MPTPTALAIATKWKAVPTAWRPTTTLTPMWRTVHVNTPLKVVPTPSHATSTPSLHWTTALVSMRLVRVAPSCLLATTTPQRPSATTSLVSMPSSTTLAEVSASTTLTATAFATSWRSSVVRMKRRATSILKPPTLDTAPSLQPSWTAMETPCAPSSQPSLQTFPQRPATCPAPTMRLWLPLWLHSLHPSLRKTVSSVTTRTWRLSSPTPVKSALMGTVRTTTCSFGAGLPQIAPVKRAPVSKSLKCLTSRLRC